MRPHEIEVPLGDEFEVRFESNDAAATQIVGVFGVPDSGAHGSWTSIEDAFKAWEEK